MNFGVDRRVPVCLAIAIGLSTVAFAQETTKSKPPGSSTWYEGRTVIGLAGKDAQMVAEAGTIVHFSDKGVPDFVGFAEKVEKDGKEDGVVQGKYGLDAKGQPENSGRLIYEESVPNAGFNLIVIGDTDIYEFHLKYLELTTVQTPSGFVAYVTKAIASDNKTSSLNKKEPVTFELPKGGALVVEKGQVMLNGHSVSVSYNCEGQTVKPPTSAPSTQPSNPSSTSKEAGKVPAAPNGEPETKH